MAQYEVNAPDGKVYTVNAPDGATQDDAIKYVQANLYKQSSSPVSVDAGKSINKGLSDIPRQIGLTARYALEGPAQAAQIFTEPVAGLMRSAGVKTKSLGEMAAGLANMIGLPQPQGANERVIGDATRLVAGAGGLAGAAGMASQLPGMAGKVFTGLATNPTQQVGSAAGAGLAGGASKEAGGDGWAQAGASLIGGVLGGLAPGAVGGVVNAGKRLMTPAMTPQQLDVKLTAILGDAGTDYSKLPGNVQRQLQAELKTSLQAGKEINPQAASRLADFALVGATPTRGMISQNPVQITREMNLAKTAANSADDSLQGMPMIQNQNNSALIGRLNDLGGRSETLPISAGRRVNDSIGATRQGFRDAEQSAWDAAKASPGYTSPISNAPLHAAIKAVDDEALIGYLPKQVTDYMGAFQTGQQPFTPQHYKNLRSMLSGELAKGGNEAAAARTAINAIDSAGIQPIKMGAHIDSGGIPITAATANSMRAADAAPGAAVDLVNQARGATRAAYQYEDSSPLVRAVMSGARGADPENIAKSFVLNGSVNDAAAIVREVGPQGMPIIRDVLATHIKKQALSNAADEVGKVSQSRLNGVLRSIGDEKLAMFFSPEELIQLKATGRVASLMQSQPVGSAVNNSNSGALLLGRGMGLLNKMPVVGPMVGPALKNIGVSVQQRQAQNYFPGLLAEQPKTPMMQGLLLPGIAVGGGLLSP